MSRIVVVGLTLPPSMSRLSRQCEILNISQSYSPPQSVTGDRFFFYFYVMQALLLNVVTQ
jgi:hypothetical protein